MVERFDNGACPPFHAVAGGPRLSKGILGSLGGDSGESTSLSLIRRTPSSAPLAFSGGKCCALDERRECETLQGQRRQLSERQPRAGTDCAWLASQCLLPQGSQPTPASPQSDPSPAIHSAFRVRAGFLGSDGELRSACYRIRGFDPVLRCSRPPLRARSWSNHGQGIEIEP